MILVLDQERVTFVSSNMDPDGKDIELEEHTHFYLKCTVSGIPTPQIMWFKVNSQRTVLPICLASSGFCYYHGWTSSPINQISTACTVALQPSCKSNSLSERFVIEACEIF
ncbi:uncharacterized protein [Palaemon carinicauda]|uniref:uncharacterized protein isoform X2 n=1 Tax=Palaemon carinicauda TaxID=392227 RepID=UPI0035B6A014